jgi:hypothetical protein
MRLELSESEQRDLARALDILVDETMNELVHTDDRSYRAWVRERVTTLQAIRGRLGSAPEAPPVYGR